MKNRATTELKGGNRWRDRCHLLDEQRRSAPNARAVPRRERNSSQQGARGLISPAQRAQWSRKNAPSRFSGLRQTSPLRASKASLRTTYAGKHPAKWHEKAGKSGKMRSQAISEVDDHFSAPFCSCSNAFASSASSSGVSFLASNWPFHQCGVVRVGRCPFSSDQASLPSSVTLKA